MHHVRCELLVEWRAGEPPAPCGSQEGLHQVRVERRVRLRQVGVALSGVDDRRQDRIIGMVGSGMLVTRLGRHLLHVGIATIAVGTTTLALMLTGTDNASAWDLARLTSCSSASASAPFSAVMRGAVTRTSTGHRSPSAARGTAAGGYQETGAKPRVVLDGVVARAPLVRGVTVVALSTSAAPTVSELPGPTLPSRRAL